MRRRYALGAAEAGAADAAAPLRAAPGGAGAGGAAWTRARERGSVRLARFMVWLVTRIGWRPGHLLLYPIAAYFLLSSPGPRRAARRFLARALPPGPRRPPGWGALFRLYFAFASTILDRVFLISGRTAGYRIEVHGLEAVQARIAEGRGCVLLGAHLGSFEALRAVADAGCPVEVAVMMHEANAARLNAVFGAIGGPGHRAAVIPLGTPASMLQAREVLERNGLVGLLADRAPGGDRFLEVPFLGRPAPFPVGPHLLAAVLGAPVMLAFGIWRGPRHYEVRFEPFADPLPPGVSRGPARQAAVAERLRRYAGRLEAICRAHPSNWFNFFDFWGEEAAR